MRKFLPLAALLLAALPATAAPLRLTLGGDYVFADRGLFEAMIAADAPLARHLAGTLRFGGFVTTTPSTLGIPLDVGLRGNVGRAYLEGLFGPWIFFNGEGVRAHGAFGFGVATSREVSLGFEIGFLTNANGMVGGRIALRL